MTSEDPFEANVTLQMERSEFDQTDYKPNLIRKYAGVFRIVGNPFHQVFLACACARTRAAGA